MFAAGAEFATTTVSVRTYLGANADGPVFAPAQDDAVFAESKRRAVLSATGDQVISPITLYRDPDATGRGLYAPLSVVTIDGRPAEVLAVNANVIGDPDVDHLEVMLA